MTVSNIFMILWNKIIKQCHTGRRESELTINCMFFCCLIAVIGRTYKFLDYLMQCAVLSKTVLEVVYV